MTLGFSGSGTYIDYFCTECGWHPMVKLTDDNETKKAESYLTPLVEAHRKETGHKRHL